MAIPSKRYERALVNYLTRSEVEALLARPDRGSWSGRRDHALMTMAVQTGLRVSELATLCCKHVQLGAGAHVRCQGKERKERYRYRNRLLPSCALGCENVPGNQLIRSFLMHAAAG